MAFARAAPLCTEVCSIAIMEAQKEDSARAQRNAGLHAESMVAQGTQRGMPGQSAAMQRLSPENQAALRSALGQPDTQPTTADLNREVAATAADAIVRGIKNLPPDTVNGMLSAAEALTFQDQGLFGRVEPWHDYRNEVAEEAAKGPQAVVGTVLAFGGPPVTQALRENAPAIAEAGRAFALDEAGSMRIGGISALRSMGLEGVELAGSSFNSGRKALENAGFVMTEMKTGRKEFTNPKTGAKVAYDSGDALVENQTPHWHIFDKVGNEYSRSGRIGSGNAVHIPAAR